MSSLFLTRSRRTALSVALAVGLAALPAVATAAVSPSYAVKGVELPSTPTQATFVGVATGTPLGDYGLWKAEVTHSTVTPGVIDRGAFSMTTNDGTRVTGDFVSGLGSIIPTSLPASPPACGRETFHVTGALMNVDSTDSPATYRDDTGFFDVTLTHYTIRSGSSCKTYFATVKGTVMFIDSAP